MLVCDEHVASQVKTQRTTIYRVQDNRLSAADALLERVQAKHDLVIGCGGCTALDVARYVGWRMPLILVPTIISTKCISVHRAILQKEDGTELRLLRQQPIQTIVPTREIANMPQELNRYWSISGVGDTLAEISAALDEAECELPRPNFEALLRRVPVASEALDWALAGRIEYCEEAVVRKFAELSHHASLEILANPQHRYYRGSEHYFYYALRRLPGFRWMPAHGWLVLLGSLLNAAVYRDSTGDATPWETLRRACCSLGVPVSLTEWSQIRVTSGDILIALNAVDEPRSLFSRRRPFTAEWLHRTLA
ncbi:NAD(P)-dependent glycerol-1-phosphate dehydrogenase [Lacunisphaera limnophila]|uniref:NAD(P)-dependent glycerol-1-phosphate dehydrogenase n=1 Tax=Lacunisphaera limnophila TaxID=1838286 RepID=A0A1D8AYZ2_9BACT|nr:iron-containing alcohol dehydrogenase [Lacunisphaera limnophila]AOS46122.1 NAD(P)-dependent glycerol-1-phosphate dehydrogenase [Lacunisphaera limnophila]